MYKMFGILEIMCIFVKHLKLIIMTIKKIDKFDRAFAQFMAASQEVVKGTEKESEIAELIVSVAVEYAEHSKFLRLCSIAKTVEDAVELLRSVRPKEAYRVPTVEEIEAALNGKYDDDQPHLFG